MTGSLIQRGKGRWTAVLHMGYSDADPETGKRKLMQQWISFGRCTKQEAQRRLNEMLAAIQKGEFVSPTKITVGEWLDTWLDESVRPALRPGTHAAYKAVVDLHLRPAIGPVTLQALRPGHLKAYYLARQEELSGATLQLHHSILSASLKSAVRQGLVARNVAALVDGKPKRKDRREEAKEHCWTAQEARQFLDAAAKAGPQLMALFALALDSGMRKGELLGVKWSDIDLDNGKITVDRTLLKAGRCPTFGPTKTGQVRVIDLSDETIRRLRDHKRSQAELKMANRSVYNDLDLVFAKEWGHLHGRQDSLGLPLQVQNLGQREFARVIDAAGVRAIKFHGLRHTAATLLLAAGVPVQVVAERLGHAKIATTLETYAHVVGGMQREAANTLSKLLFGR